MNDIALSLHYVRVKRQREKGFAFIHCFGDDSDDLLNVIANILATLQELDNDRKRQNVLEVSQIRQSGREIYGTIKSGAYGIESELYDVRETEEKGEVIKKRSFHAEMIPFFFHFDLPEGEDKGVLALQRIGQFGISQPFALSLTRNFRRHFPSHVLSLNSVMSKDIIEQCARDDSVLRGIHYLRHTLSSDLADGLSQNRQSPVQGSIDFAINLRESGFPFLERVREMIRGNASHSELYELIKSSVTFDFDDVKIMTRTGGRDRTVILGNPTKGFRADYDITAEVEMSGGHPVLESIYTIARGLIADLWRQSRGSGE
jgi:hypothetical protein